MEREIQKDGCDMSKQGDEDLTVMNGGNISVIKSVGKKARKFGKSPSILLRNPKYSHNVGGVVRAVSCWGLEQVWYTGNRISLDISKSERLPREERMKGYSEVDLVQFDYPYEQFTDVVPVAIELTQGAVQIQDFTHPENALYVFGPEDGSISKVDRMMCHHFVVLPTRYCLNLASAVNCVLMHRTLQRHELGLERIPPQEELLKQDRVCLGR